MDDESFVTGSREALDVLESAKLLKEWCELESNESVLVKFTHDLFSDLRGTFSNSSKLNSVERKKLWRSFFLLRSSPPFVLRWVHLLESAGANLTPVLYQHLTDIILKYLIHQHSDISAMDTAITVSTDITDIEA